MVLWDGLGNISGGQHYRVGDGKTQNARPKTHDAERLLRTPGDVLRYAFCAMRYAFGWGDLHRRNRIELVQRSPGLVTARQRRKRYASTVHELQKPVTNAAAK